MRWEPLSKPKGWLSPGSRGTGHTDLVRNLRGEAGLLAGARRRAMHGGDFLEQGSAPPSPAGSATPGLQLPAQQLRNVCRAPWRPRSLAQEAAARLAGRSRWRRRAEAEGRVEGWWSWRKLGRRFGGGGRPSAPGPSQAASLPAAGGWMGRLQAAAAAAEAAAAAAAVSAASTDHLTHPPIGNRGPRSARSLLSPLPLPPNHGRALPGRLSTSGAGLPECTGRAGGLEALPSGAHA